MNNKKLFKLEGVSEFLALCWAVYRLGFVTTQVDINRNGEAER